MQNQPMPTEMQDPMQQPTSKGEGELSFNPWALTSGFPAMQRPGEWSRNPWAQQPSMQRLSQMQPQQPPLPEGMPVLMGRQAGNGRTPGVFQSNFIPSQLPTPGG